MKIKWVAFDADDTLWESMLFYQKAVDQVISILMRYAHPHKILQEFRTIENDNIPALGYGTKSFIISMLEAALKITSQQIQANEIQNIMDIGKSLIRHPVQLLNHVEKTLRELAVSTKLMLLTKGDLLEQQKKAERSGLSQCFDIIEIVVEKNEQIYSNLLHKYNIRPETFLMVGNSLKSDIMPVVHIGGNAVYIPHQASWHYEDISITDLRQSYVEMNDIRDLPALIHRLNTGKKIRQMFM